MKTIKGLKPSFNINNARIGGKKALDLLCNEPILVMTNFAMEKFQHYIKIAKGEVGGLAKLSYRVDNIGKNLVFMCHDIHLIEQDASAGMTYLDPIKVMEWMEQIEPGWREKNDRPALLWWHSHVDMDVWFSHQDELAITALMAFGGYVVSIVGNKRGEQSIRVDFKMPVVDTPLHIDEVKLHVIRDPELTQDELDALTEDFHKKVRQNAGDHQLMGLEAKVARLKKQIEKGGQLGEAASKALAEVEKKLADEKKWRTSTSKSWRDNPKGGVAHRPGEMELCRGCDENTLVSHVERSSGICNECHRRANMLN